MFRGHSIKRNRQDNETEYEYRKGIATDTTHTLSNDDLSDDPAATTALSIQRSLRCIFKLNKTHLQTKINESRDTVDILRQHGEMK